MTKLRRKRHELVVWCVQHRKAIHLLRLPWNQTQPEVGQVELIRGKGVA